MTAWLRALTAVLVLAAGCAHVGRPSASPPPADVILVIVDGLAAEAATPERMPRLAAAAWERGSWLTADGVMPARTNPNHASLLTGTEPDAHGITGNWYWDGTAEREMGDPALLEVETVFTAVERQRPALTTATAFAKAKLRRLFGAAPGRQSSPDVSWRPADDDLYAASDAETMSGFRGLVRTYRPAFAVVALADVDAVGHRDGPEAPSYGAAVENVDRLIGTLVDDLRETGRWNRSIVVVTADHGFDELLPAGAGRIVADAVVAGGAHFVADGGVAHVYAGPPGSLDATIAKARRHPGVAAVYAREPRPDAPPPPAAWHASHPRMGDVILVARPGFTFVSGRRDPTQWFRGNHGAPDERAVPFVVVGGYPTLHRASGTPRRPSAADVVPTVAMLLGITPPRRIDGTPVAAAERGRVLNELFRDR
jgi:arylsulfatase A-like enzyme